MKLSEIYQEDDSIFASDGKKYDLNLLFKLANDKQPENFKISDLDWVLKYDTPRQERVSKANTSIPILVTKRKNDLLVIDGLHRLAKAKANGKKTISGKMISQSEFEKAEIA